MSHDSRPDQPVFLPVFLAAVCGLAVTAPALAQPGNPFGGGETPQDNTNPFSTNDVQPENVDLTVSEHLTVDLHVQDEELSNVLQILSLQSEKNILVSGDVSATVNANLYNVTFYEALDAILNVNGYGYVEKGNFIYVYTLAEIEEIKQAAREPVTRVIRLNYLNANDAAEFVTPLLSEVGSIKSSGDVDAFSIPDGNPVGDETYALSSMLVIYDYAEHVDEIEHLLADLDTRPAQVLVEATILETSLREMNGFGIDFSFISDLDFTDFVDIGGPLSTTQGIINGGDGTSGGLSPLGNQALSGTSTAGNVAGGSSTFKLGIIDDNVSFFLRALDDITDVSVLSRPKVMALNRQPARVLVGRRIGYLSTTSTETSTTQTVEFLDTGTQLKFRAFVGNDGFIRMELHPSTSTGETREAASAGGAAVTIPEEVTQEITTNVLVKDGSTVVLGGLFRESTTLSRRQVPVLGDLPIIGSAFRGNDDDTRRSEIIFMITPTIVNDQVLTETGEVASDYVENVRTGSRAGLLPWSRDKQSSELNVKAEQAAMDGDPAKGLYLIRRSLELNPNQPDAIRLREQLLQQQEAIPSRSVLEDVFDEELNDLLSKIEPLPAYEFDKNKGFKNDAHAETIVAGPLPEEGADFLLSLPPEAEQALNADEPAPALAEAKSDPEFRVESEPAELSAPAEEAFKPEQTAEAFDTLIDWSDISTDDLTPADFADQLPEPAVASAPIEGQTASPGLSETDEQFENLRLTVTVAPSAGEPEPKPTTVTLAPDTAFTIPAEKAADAAKPEPPKPWADDVLALKPDAVTPEPGSKPAPAETDPSPSKAPDAGDAPEGPGLIGPAFAQTPDDANGLNPGSIALSGDGTFFGGFWLWFRDSVVLDAGAQDHADEATAEADPDKD